MRTLAVSVSLVALVALAAPATPQVSEAAKDLSLVAAVEFPRSTHLEFLQRDGRTYALIGSRDDAAGGIRFIDVTDPTAPELVGFAPCQTTHNQDPAVSPDTTLVTLTQDGAGGCPVNNGFPPPGFRRSLVDVGFIDATDVTKPMLFGTPQSLPAMDGIHTAVFHPTENLVYLSDQQTPSRNAKLWIVDFRDPTATAAEVLRAGTFEVHQVAMPQVGDGPHDITFSPDGTRAYVSAITASYVLDTTDPLAPTPISYILDAGISIHHEGMLHPNGRHLFVVDEQAGAIAAPQCPGGGVHVYDLAVEAAPVKVGIVFANDITPVGLNDAVSGELDPDNLSVCTAHEGNFSVEGDRFAMGWYQGGSRVFDTSLLNTPGLPPGAPVGWLLPEVAFIRPQPVNVWAAKIHPVDERYVIASNQRTGLEVYELAGA